MGTYRKDGYSAMVEAYFVCKRATIPLARTNGRTFVVAEPCMPLEPGTRGELLVIIDEFKDSKRVILPNGICEGDATVRYDVEAPF